MFMRRIFVALTIGLIVAVSMTAELAFAQELNSVQNQFDREYAEWQKQRENSSVRYSSNTKDYVALPAFRSIVALGRPALPYLKEQMKTDFMLAYAVAEICGWQRTDFPAYGEQDFRDMVLEKMAEEGY
jgi:hypothetical protein